MHKTKITIYILQSENGDLIPLINDKDLAMKHIGEIIYVLGEDWVLVKIIETTVN